MSLGPSAILGGKYRLEEPIGHGGMGEVFRATDLARGQAVAIKVVNRSFADPLLMERLAREAEAARRVQSPFVPQLYDVDKTPDGELFLVMELLHGETLASRLRSRDGLLPWEDVSRIGDDVLRGLMDAHAAGVIHRDLKPGNIFIERLTTRRERARILDFGVCKLDVHDGESLTHTGEAVGTIAYMAPEQIRGASHVDERADVYAFAMVVFEALSGRLAYDATGSIALIASKLEQPALSILKLAHMAMPPGLDALLGRCLSRSPVDRPATAAELLREWRALGPATVDPVTWPIGRVRSEPPTDAGMTAAPSIVVTTEKRGARAWLLVASGALVASSAVLLAGLRAHSSAPSATFDTTAATTAAKVAASRSAPTVEPAPTPPETAPADEATAPALQISPVVLSSSPDSSNAAQSPRAPSTHGRPTKHTWTPPPAPRAATTEPQIVAEPRY